MLYIASVYFEAISAWSIYEIDVRRKQRHVLYFPWVIFGVVFLVGVRKSHGFQFR